MKKIYTLLFASLIGLTANAAIHNVSVIDFAFSPATVTANVGDTIRWTLGTSTTHTTTSTSVPSGAAAWDRTLTSSAPSFDYVIPMAGTYNYFCSLHPQMTGTITATSGTGISNNAASFMLSAYPNPFKDKVTLTHTTADVISVFNMVGEVVMKQAVEATEVKTLLDLSALPAGVYFVNIVKEGMITGTKRIVKG